MSNSLLDALSAVAERLKLLAAEDAELRANLRALAAAFLEATDEHDADGTDPPPDLSAATSPPDESERLFFEQAPPKPVEPHQAAVPDTRAPADAASDAWAPAPVEITDSDLPLIETRCRLKAEGARWAATRQRRLADGADFAAEIEPKDRDIIERAKALPDCFLWMCHPSGPSPANLTLFEDVAACFDSLADAVALVRIVAADPDRNWDAFVQALDLLAEAQSALRVAIDTIGGRTDTDQHQVHNWLRTTSAKRQVFIPRYMQLNDPASPQALADLDQRIEQLDSALASARQQEKQQQSLIKRIRYHAKQITDSPDDDHEHDWHRIAESVQELVNCGTPPSNTEIRELLLPVVESMPDLDDWPDGFRLALREIDRYLASRPPSAESSVTAAAIPEIEQAAELLRGKSVVLIGGLRRRFAQDALKTAFGLKELDWIDVPKHESVSTFEPNVARKDVALVLLAVRWSSHGYGDVKQFCDKFDKPLVRLPAGYNPNQVAVQIMSQCGERLAARR